MFETIFEEEKEMMEDEEDEGNNKEQIREDIILQLYASCLKKNSIINRKCLNKEIVTDEEFEVMQKLYDMLLEIPELNICMGKNIRERKAILDLLKKENRKNY